MAAQPPRAKIFGIGLNKTGTTTLHECGRILGYRCTSCSRSLLDDVITRRDFTEVKRVVAEYDLFEDWPWPLIYRDLDQLFPGSKFVLTVRKSEDSWLKSLRSHSLRTSPVRTCRKLAYGFDYPHGHEQEHIDFYNRHNSEVRQYFSNRPDDFIELCWEQGDGFAELCRFLDVEQPDAPLPHANRASDQPVQPMRVLKNYGRIALSRIADPRTAQA